MNKKVKCLIGALAVTVGVTSVILLSNKKVAPTESELIEVQNKLLTSFQSDVQLTSNEIKELLDDNIKYMDQVNRNTAVDIYLSSKYRDMGDLNSKLQLLGNEVEWIVDKYDVNVTKPHTYSKAPNEYGTAVGFLKELGKKDFQLIWNKDVLAYVVGVDLQPILDNYGEYVSPSMKSYLEFNNYENKNQDFYDASNNKIDFKEVLNRINMINTGIENDFKEEIKYTEEWALSKKYYYEILAGVNQYVYVDEEGKIMQEYIDNIKTIIEDNKDNEIGAFASAIVNEYENAELKYSDDLMAKLSAITYNYVYTDELKEVLGMTETTGIEVQANTETE